MTLLERHALVGGRASLLETDGYRWDTGPSWYLMREAFDQFFALMGTSTEEQLDLIDLDPRYRVFFEGDDAAGPAESLDVVADPEANYALFNRMSPGDGDAMREYAAESKELYHLALDRFLYTTFERPDKVANARVVPQAPDARLAAHAVPGLQGGRARCATSACARSWASTRCSSAPPPRALPRCSRS